MKSLTIKKTVSIILAVMMLITALPSAVFAAEALPVMKAYRTVNGDYHDYKKQVVTVTFLDRIDTEGALQSWDVSEAQDDGVIAWMKENKAESEAAGETRYDVYIGGNGGVSANPVSSDLFFGFENLKEIKGLENFDTSNATTFAYMFQQCKSIRTLDLSSFDTSNVTTFLWMFVDCISLETLNLHGWNTSKVTTMDSMFKNCVMLNPLDISSFDTSNVENMANMFYRCESLKTLYVGDGWQTEQVTSSNAMFNCCYLIEGKKSYSDPDISYPHDKKYATQEYFVTYKAPEAPEKYTVSYEFIGDIIPEGVKAPDAYSYNAGSVIKVEDVPEAEGYVFSGWTTTDAEVVDGEFVINNDVHFVGSWSKLYTVTYKYAEGFEVPEGAPELPAAVQYQAGTSVDVLGVPYVDRYLFIGWTTDDADVAGDMFIMPENDVVLYGYFKIPVESIEIMNDGDIVINKDEQTRLNIYVKPEDATIKTVVYETSNPDVVTVDKYGNIKAVGEGTATVTVASKDDPTKRDTITVTVKIPVTEIYAEPAEITLKKGEEDTIEVFVNEDATNKDIIFESEDESVVIIDENGKLTAVGDGETTVVITSADDPSKKVTVKVTVKNPVTELEAGEDFTLEIDEVRNVDASVNSDATDKTLFYESSDPGVVKVDSNGDVIAVGEGTATITVTSKDNPELKETVTVTVVRKYKVTYEFTGSLIPEGVIAPGEKTYNNGTEVAVEAEAFAEGYTFSGWATEDATVEGGSFIIRNDVCFVGYFSKDVKDIVVEEDAFELEIGGKDKINVTVTPDDATDKGVTFETSDETVVKVDENGNIEAVGEGTATITVTSEYDESIKETVTVTVKKSQEPDTPDTPEEPECVITVPEMLSLYTGETKNLGVTITPDDGTVKPVYKIENTDIATVDADGNVKALKVGVTTLSVDFGGGDIRVIPVRVTAAPVVTPEKTHYVCFGKTDGIGWYEVSVNGGDFFPQGPNSTLEVPDGAVLVVRVQDMWIDDEFDFYVNGSKVPLDPANTITVVVDGYMLIGALSMDVEVPDVEESLSLLDKIKNFFVDVINWFRNLFKR